MLVRSAFQLCFDISFINVPEPKRAKILIVFALLSNVTFALLFVLFLFPFLFLLLANYRRARRALEEALQEHYLDDDTRSMGLVFGEEMSERVLRDGKIMVITVATVICGAAMYFLFRRARNRQAQLAAEAAASAAIASMNSQRTADMSSALTDSLINAILGPVTPVQALESPIENAADAIITTFVETVGTTATQNVVGSAISYTSDAVDAAATGAAEVAPVEMQEVTPEPLSSNEVATSATSFEQIPSEVTTDYSTSYEALSAQAQPQIDIDSSASQ